MAVSMHPVVKKLWLKALRSKKYKQGQRRLRTFDNSFCCLGVLCDVTGATWRDDGAPIARDGTRMAHAGFLGAPMLNAAGITNDQQRELAIMNDEGASFPEIADYIEANL